ncbi:sugar kinase [Streptomyces antioxidans]|uniref:Sugar kinase n=1 Tax=Streptomyces antioxidans TaxID=1507734 RepID=A0A1V4D949_9ACTN|nr:ROK family protein [Streptomyces antioxidans]OPF81612.1 sugar kinase [Streptomyces antioxidans]
MTAKARTAQPSLRTTVRDPRRGSRSSLLWTLYLHAPLSRQELVRRTGVGATTASAVIDELIAEGVVKEEPVAGDLVAQHAVAHDLVTDAQPPRLRLASEHRYVIGVEVADTRVRVGLFDLALTQRAGAVHPLPAGPPPEHGAETAARHILTFLDAVVEEAGIPHGHILGVGVGVSATGWDGAPLERLLRTGTALPLHIDNGAEALGRAEMWFGAGRGLQHAVVALIGSGVSASVITHGSPYRGATDSAGQWGHTTVQAGGRSCRCGARGCLEAYIGADAVLERYRQARRGRFTPGADRESAFAVLLAAADTSSAAQRVLEEAAVYLGAGIANLVNLFNPQRIILGGWAGLMFGARMLPRIRETIAAQALRRPYAQTDIELCGLGPHAVALGAAALPLRHFLTDGAHRPATTPRRALTRAAPTTRMSVP